MAGDLSYFTIPIADMGRARAFYGGVFGWQFAADADDRYAHITNTTPPGGLNAAEVASPRVWFKVEDIHAAVARVRTLGGKADDPQQSPSGWSAECHDDQGGRFNLWQPAAGY